MALPARMRFLDRSHVRRVLNRGRRFETPLGRVSLLPAGALGGRILFVVSSRVSKKSVRRHAIKRHLDEWAKREIGRLMRHDVIVYIRPDAGNATRLELLDRAGLMLNVLFTDRQRTPR